MAITVYSGSGESLQDQPLALPKEGKPSVRVVLSREELKVADGVRSKIVSVLVHVRMQNGEVEESKRSLHFKLRNSEWFCELSLSLEPNASVTLDIPETTSAAHATFQTASAAKAGPSHWITGALVGLCFAVIVLIFAALGQNDDLPLSKIVTALVTAFIPGVFGLLRLVPPARVPRVWRDAWKWLPRFDRPPFWLLLGLASSGALAWLSFVVDLHVVNRGPSPWHNIGRGAQGRVNREALAPLVSSQEGWTASALPNRFMALFGPDDVEVTCTQPKQFEGQWCSSSATAEDSVTTETWKQCLAGLADGSGGAEGCGLTQERCGTAWIRDSSIGGTCKISHLLTLDPNSPGRFNAKPSIEMITLQRFVPGNGKVVYIGRGDSPTQSACSPWTPDATVRVEGGMTSCDAIPLPWSKVIKFRDVEDLATCRLDQGSPDSLELIELNGATTTEASATVSVVEPTASWKTELPGRRLRFCVTQLPVSAVDLPNLSEDIVRLPTPFVEMTPAAALKDGKDFAALRVGGSPVRLCLGDRPLAEDGTYALISRKKRWWLIAHGGESRIASCERLGDPCPGRTALIAELKVFTDSAHCGPVTISVGPKNQLTLVSEGSCSLPPHLGSNVGTDYSGCTV